MTRYCSNPSCPARWSNFRRKKCPSCGQFGTALKRIPRGTSLSVIPDFPEHFNVSMGCVVKNRAHHRQIQKARGLQDWEPCRNSPGSQLSLGRKQ